MSQKMGTGRACEILEGIVCTCGMPAQALHRLHQYMKFVRTGDIDDIYDQEYADQISDDVVLIMYLLNDLGVLDHKRSIMHSYMTDYGRLVWCALNTASTFNYDIHEMLEVTEQ